VKLSLFQAFNSQPRILSVVCDGYLTVCGEIFRQPSLVMKIWLAGNGVVVVGFRRRCIMKCSVSLFSILLLLNARQGRVDPYVMPDPT
jgi:hypothetical protein